MPPSDDVVSLQLQKKKAPKGKSRPPVRSTRVPTFFDFFSPPVVPETESELTEEGMDALQNALEKDYELGYAQLYTPPPPSPSPPSSQGGGFVLSASLTTLPSKRV